MEQEALQKILGPEIDLDRLRSELLQAKPDPPPTQQDLIAYLFENKQINFKQLELIHQAEPVTMSEADELQQHLKNNQVQSKLYEILEPLGQGAMGVVHLAKDRSLLREVAYKSLLSPEHGVPQIVIRRFLNEVQITAQLDHPQIIPIYHLSATSAGMPAYTMKCIQGKTFKELITEARQQLENGSLDDLHQQNQLLDYFLKVCDAMAYAHSRAVIHRDLKPANLMVGAYGDVYVMDWGIAKRFYDPDVIGIELNQGADSGQDDPDATQMGQILGTPRYMSPQQAAAKNNELDGRSDLFSLGLILFEILSLRPAFTGAKTQIDLLKKVLKAELNPLQSPDKSWPISPAMRAIVAKATARKAAARYARVEDFAQDIRHCINDQVVSVYQEPVLYRLLRTARRHGRITLLSTMAIATAFMILTGVSLAIQVQASRTTARREAQVAKLLAVGGTKAQAIDSAFLNIQNQLDNLAASTQALLTQKQISSNPPGLFWSDRYKTNSPPDFRYSSFYKQSISLKEGVFVAPPGQSQDALKTQAQQIYPLKNLLSAIFKNASETSLSQQAYEDQFREKGSLLDWGYVALASGLHYAYPGKAGYPEDYDPRQRPWYQEAKSKTGSFWGRPYLDIGGLGLILPCLNAVHDANGQVSGVVGLELRLSRILENFLSIPEQNSVTHLYLADQDGQVLVDSAQADAVIHVANQVEPLPSELITQILKESNGVFETKNALWFFYRINALNWYYILKVDPANFS